MDDHPDLQPQADGYEDVQTVKLMADAAAVNRLLLNEGFSSDEAKKTMLDVLNKKWSAYIGHVTYVAGNILAEYEGRLVSINDGERSSGYFQGFRSDWVVGDDGIHEVLRYQFSSSAVVGSDADEIRFTADIGAHLEFPELISLARLRALAEPLIASVDEIMMAEDVDSTTSAILALRDANLPLFFEAEDENGPVVCGYLADYLTKMSGLSSVSALKLALEGTSYSRALIEPHDTNGDAVLVSPTFFVKEFAPGYGELCLLGKFVQRGNKPVVEDRIIPLDIITNITEVGE